MNDNNTKSCSDMYLSVTKIANNKSNIATVIAE